MIRDALNRGLEKRELVADERVRADEVSLIGVVAVSLGPVDEVEDGLEVGGLLDVNRLQGSDAGRVLFNRRLRMTSSTSALVSFTRVRKRAWILEKSLPCCLVRSPRTLSMSS